MMAVDPEGRKMQRLILSLFVTVLLISPAYAAPPVDVSTPIAILDETRLAKKPCKWRKAWRIVRIAEPIAGLGLCVVQTIMLFL